MIDLFLSDTKLLKKIKFNISPNYYLLEDFYNCCNECNDIESLTIDANRLHKTFVCTDKNRNLCSISGALLFLISSLTLILYDGMLLISLFLIFMSVVLMLASYLMNDNYLLVQIKMKYILKYLMLKYNFTYTDNSPLNDHVTTSFRTINANTSTKIRQVCSVPNKSIVTFSINEIRYIAVINKVFTKKLPTFFVTNPLVQVNCKGYNKSVHYCNGLIKRKLLYSGQISLNRSFKLDNIINFMSVLPQSAIAEFSGSSHFIIAIPIKDLSFYFNNEFLEWNSLSEYNFISVANRAEKEFSKC